MFHLWPYCFGHQNFKIFEEKKQKQNMFDLSQYCFGHLWWSLGVQTNWYKIATKAEPLRSQFLFVNIFWKFIFVCRENKNFVQNILADWVSWISILWIFSKKYLNVLNIVRQIFGHLWQILWIFWQICLKFSNKYF